MKKNKLLISLLLSLATVLSFAPFSIAQNEIPVYINEQELTFDVPPMIENGTTLVPLRAIFESLGAQVEWDTATQTATGTKEETIITLKLNAQTAMVNQKEVTLALPAKEINGRILVPLRFISESFACTVDWLPETQTITITTPDYVPIVWHSEGTYKVGTDIAAGEYFVQSKDNLGCYLSINKDSTGAMDSIIANANTTTHTFVTVMEGQYLQIKRGKFTKADTATVPKAQDGKYIAGTYRVGTDIPAGEYKVSPTDVLSGYLEVTKDSSKTFQSILTNENFTGDTYITVAEGQYLTVTRGEFVLVE